MATMNDTMNAAKNVLDSARETADQTYSQARSGTEHAVESARSTFFDGLHTAASVAKLVRSLTPDDALGWVGLARKTSAAWSFAIFGAGFAAGAAGALLLAPMKGDEMRRLLLKRILGAEADVQAKVESGAEKAQDKADEVVTAAKKGAEKIEKKVEEKVEPFKDTLGKGAQAFSSAIKDVADTAKAPSEAIKAQHNGPSHRS